MFLSDSYLSDGQRVRDHLYVGLALAVGQILGGPRPHDLLGPGYHMFALQEHLSLNEYARYIRGAQSADSERHLHFTNKEKHLVLVYGMTDPLGN